MSNIRKIDRENTTVIEQLEDCLNQVKSGKLDITKILIIGEGDNCTLRKHNHLRRDEIVWMLEVTKINLLNECS